MMKLFAPLAVLLIASLVILSSISPRLFLLQALWIILGFGVVYLFTFVDWRSIFDYEWFVAGLYILAIALLLFVYLRGPVIRNAKSWIVVGPFSFQPVEAAKIALILFYARYFSRRHLAIARWKHIAVSFALFAIPAVLVAIQPNLGSAIVLFGIWFGFLLSSGLPMRRLAPLVTALILGSAMLWTFGMKPYQRARISGFLYPKESTLSINYNTIQSEVAVGSGGFWGKGYGQGSQVQLGFLPEPESDFILAAFIEEWGFAGGFLVLAAFCAFEFEIARIGMRARQNAAKYVCLGAMITFGVQFCLNAGSVFGLMPVVGIPLPFVSYGGTDILVSFLLVAIVNSVRLSSRTTHAGGGKTISIGQLIQLD